MANQRGVSSLNGDSWLLKAIFAEALKVEDIEFLRKLFEAEKSNKKIRLQMVEKMIANAENMQAYIREEKITEIMSMLGGRLHWYLVFTVNQYKLDEKKKIVGWNTKCQKIIEKKTVALREKMFNEFGKWRFSGGDDENIEEAIAMLRQEAEEALNEIESFKKREK